MHGWWHFPTFSLRNGDGVYLSNTQLFQIKLLVLFKICTDRPMFQIHICERNKCILSVKKTSKHKMTSRTEDKIAIKKYISNLVKIVRFWKTSISYTQCQEMGKPKKNTNLSFISKYILYVQHVFTDYYGKLCIKLFNLYIISIIERSIQHGSNYIKMRKCSYHVIKPV